MLGIADRKFYLWSFKVTQEQGDRSLLLQVKSRPGRFVVKGSDLVMVFSGEFVNRKLSDRINNAFAISRQRTEQQDVEFSVNQLVDIALRAISPGIDDPTTAIECIDSLSIASTDTEKC